MTRLNLTVFVYLGVSRSPPATCEVQTDGRVLLFDAEARLFKAAFFECQRNGGELLKVRNAAENEFIFNLARRLGSNVWLDYSAPG